MFTSTKSWLAKHYGIPETQVEEFFNHTDISGFLLIWTVFERDLFGTEFKSNDVHSYKIQNENTLSRLKSAFTHFHKIYQDRKRYKNLVGKKGLKENKEDSSITNTKNKPDTETNSNEQLSMLLYVVFRYRNNIFHGSKGAESWLQYSTEINYCIDVMKILLEDRLDSHS